MKTAKYPIAFQTIFVQKSASNWTTKEPNQVEARHYLEIVAQQLRHAASAKNIRKKAVVSYASRLQSKC
ncbi:MAG: hypothetical protein ACXWTR_05260 [Methylotenera sp.]